MISEIFVLQDWHSKRHGASGEINLDSIGSIHYGSPTAGAMFGGSLVITPPADKIAEILVFDGVPRREYVRFVLAYDEFCRAMEQKL